MPEPFAGDPAPNAGNRGGMAVMHLLAISPQPHRLHVDTEHPPSRVQLRDSGSFLADFISAPTLIGFKAGTGLLIAAGQLGKVLGAPQEADNFFSKVGSTLRNLGATSWGDGSARGRQHHPPPRVASLGPRSFPDFCWSSPSACSPQRELGSPIAVLTSWST